MVKQTTALPDAVVTVVTYNSAADIEVCVRSLAAHFPLLAAGRPARVRSDYSVTARARGAQI